MSFSGSSKKSKTTTNTNTSGSRDPWGPTIPYLNNILKSAGAAGGVDPTPDQLYSYEFLKNNAFEGNPWDVDAAGLANERFASAGYADEIGAAYDNLDSQVGGVARGDYLDPSSNPQMQAMLTQVGDDIQHRINRSFAAAGRDMSGKNQNAVASGIASAQLPILLNQYNQERSNQANASQALYGAATSGAGQKQALVDANLATREGGVNVGQAALDMRNQGANQIIELDQQIQQLPYENLGMLSQIVNPVAGLGGDYSEQGTSQSKGKSSGFGFGVSLSDERAKDNIEQIGSMDDGTPLYRYTYKDDDTNTIHIGPIAQEVEQLTPGAVLEDQQGTKYVDMDAATRRAADIIKSRQGGNE